MKKIKMILLYGLGGGVAAAIVATVFRQIVVSHDPGVGYNWIPVINFGILGFVFCSGIYILVTSEKVAKWCQKHLWR